MSVPEYMNSAKDETFSGVKACANYSVLIADSGKVYISSQTGQDQPFMPIFGKAQQAHKGKQSGLLKRLTDIFLCKHYLIAMD